MGKLNYDPFLQHFSHEHAMELSNTQQAMTTASCSGCKLKISGWFYTCKACDYSLHITCSQMSQFIHHPVDPNHPLYLLTSPAYPEGYFNCDACGRRGYGFSYHCHCCELDIHTFCASMPLSLTHQAHHHPLNLVFFPPYQNKGFSCDICNKLGSNHWLYRCNICEFDAHLGCATIKTKPQFQGLPQHQMLLPAAPQFQGLGGGSANGTRQSFATNYHVNNPSAGRNGMNNHGLMNRATEAFVDSTVQNLVQSVFRGGNDGGNGGGDSSNSNSVLEMGSSVFSTVFGGSNSSNN